MLDGPYPYYKIANKLRKKNSDYSNLHDFHGDIPFPFVQNCTKETL